MQDSGLGSSGFPTTQCESCGKSVLTYADFDSTGAEQRRCVHCDAPAGAMLEWVTAEELEVRGYAFGAPPARRPGGGCGGGCSSCSMKRHAV